MDRRPIKSVTEANSMQPATWTVIDKETFDKRNVLPSWHASGDYLKECLKEINIETVRIDGDPYEVVIGRNFANQPVFQWQIKAVNLTFINI